MFVIQTLTASNKDRSGLLGGEYCQSLTKSPVATRKRSARLLVLFQSQPSKVSLYG